MAKLRFSLQSSTLIEVIIAMLIVLICLFIAFNVYIKTNASANFLQRIQAHLLTEDIFTNTKSKKEYIDKQFEFNNITIHRMIKPYPKSINLVMIELIAMTKKGRILFTKKEVVRILDKSE